MVYMNLAGWMILSTIDLQSNNDNNYGNNNNESDTSVTCDLGRLLCSHSMEVPGDSRLTLQGHCAGRACLHVSYRVW